jgi:ADP-heptose:LPS heptosyltransferase
VINRVLLYNSGGGVGDAIQILPLINTLKTNFKNAKFFYLCAHKNYFNSTLSDFNCSIDSLDFGVKYFGFRWWHALIIKNKIKKYNIGAFDLIIDLQSKIRNSLILKIIPHKYFISTCMNFKLSRPSLEIRKQKKINNTIISAINYILDTNFQLSEYNINQIDKRIFIESEKLLPKNNYVGFSITQGNIYRKKEWPLSNIIKICNKLEQNNKIPVFFVIKKNFELKNKIKKLIPSALFPEHETNFNSPALVTCLGKRLNFAITIDNGIMHMLSLAKVPMISLFGPTNSEKFAPEYKNSIVLDSKKLHNTKNVSAITVENVLNAAKQLSDY